VPEPSATERPDPAADERIAAGPTLGPAMSAVRASLVDLETLLRERSRRTAGISQTAKDALARLDAAWTSGTRDARAARDRVVENARRAFDERSTSASATTGARLDAARQKLETGLASLDERVAEKRTRIEKDAKEAVWLSETVAESDDRQSASRLEALEERVERQRARLAELVQRAGAVRDELRTPTFRVTTDADDARLDRTLDEHRDRVEAELAGKKTSDDDDDEDEAWMGKAKPRGFRPDNPDDLASFAEHEQAGADGLLTSAGDGLVITIARGPGFATLAGTLVVAAAGLGWLLDGWRFGLGLIVAAAAAAALIVPLRLILARGADRVAERRAGELSASLTRARLALDRAEAAGERRRETERAEIAARQRTEAAEAREKCSRRLERLEAEAAERRRSIEEPLAARIDELESQLAETLANAERERDTTIAEAERDFERDTAEAAGVRDRSRRDAEAARDRDLAALREDWSERSNRLARQIERLAEETDGLLPAWRDPDAFAADRDADVTDHAAFGRLPIDLHTFDGGLPEPAASEAVNEGTPPPPLRWPVAAEFELPAMLEFPVRGSLLIEADSARRSAALELLQAAVLRVVTTLPPGKARFTFVDPVGLGQSFAAFMHLADHDDQLVSGRIWTEPRHIEQRLLDLTEHMENVIQKYLRNEFANIEQYNERAGEIAEPYRFLILADFPANMSDVAARRLASIASSGARCGVHMLVLATGHGEPPKNLSWDDLRDAALVIRPADAAGDDAAPADDRGGFCIDDPVLRRYPLLPSSLPEADRMTALLREVGRRSTDASQVRVPFEAVGPGDGERWTADSADGLRVPLGRSGANRLQQLELGAGTLQHALIAGKTGSGKSTLLHVLITNASLWYGPDELELYLVDFKKGVEFKTYAQRGFPHARVVAIETDREFGLSVLRRVDEELARRGSLFRDANAQNVPGFRAATGEPMPRVLLVIDEFQELFVEDDRIAQEAALLLDRLVRQGRAFGVHVVLGSQTLGGAYSLARTTMSQMNVRIALQCDEQDSYIILSEDNAAARLLSRPGEAIYNDAGGKLEGNSPFQIVWLPEAKRRDALATVALLAEDRSIDAPATIVFEGNVPAEAARNDELVQAAHGRGVEGPLRLWLGEPTAIEGPIHVPLLRRGGQNAVVVGQQEDTADALLSMAAVSFAAEHLGRRSAERSTLYILDGTPDELAGAEALRDVAETLPLPVRLGGVRDAEPILLELAAEIDRRHDLGAASEPTLLLLVNALHRFRDLRKSDDFSFSSFSSGDDDRPASDPIDKVFADLLERGPEVGVHVLVWCDTATNLERTLDRRLLKEFDTRVLFQMGAMDSTGLIDSPAASKLGPNRGIISHEETGSSRTFRPYRRPDPEWLAQLWSDAGAGPPSIG